MREIIFLAIFLSLVSFAYGALNSVGIVPPDNISGDPEIGWLSETFMRSIQLELRKAKMSVKIIDKGNAWDSDFLIISSYRRAKDGRRIIFFVNLLGKGDFFVNGENISVIDSFAFAFLPEVIYEAKTNISRILRLYIEGCSSSGEMKFRPLRYKFPDENVERAKKRISGISFGKVDIKKIFSDPSETILWFELGIAKLREGDAASSISFLLRFIMKYAPDFPSEKDVLSDRNIILARDILSDLMPGNSSKRIDALNHFIISQFYRDFSENEIENLLRSIEMDAFLWPSMRRLGEVYYARGDYKQSLRYMKDYISTSNENYGFVIVFSRVLSLVDELARGF